MNLFGTEHLVAGAAEELVNVVAGAFETGHIAFKDYREFKREYPTYGKAEWGYYNELINMGPAGFYEEFKDDYDFDPMFVEEYGDPDYEEEVAIDRMYHDADEDELRAMGCFGDEEEDYE